MEAWQVTHYRAPHLVPFSAHLADDGQTVVLAADAKEYEIQFSGVDGGRVLDSVLAMANPDAEIWFDIHAGSAPSWQLSLARQLDGKLPHYARPIFLRLSPQIEVTGTFKQRKVELVQEGFNPGTIADPLYWLNPATGRYEPLDAAHYADIVEDRYRL